MKIRKNYRLLCKSILYDCNPAWLSDVDSRLNGDWQNGIRRQLGRNHRAMVSRNIHLNSVFTSVEAETALACFVGLSLSTIAILLDGRDGNRGAANGTRAGLRGRRNNPNRKRLSRRFHSLGIDRE